MRSVKLLVMICVLVLTANAFAVYTPHIWDVNTQGEYTGATMYVKGPKSGGPDNSPMHESWNLVDELIDGNPNPHYIGGPQNGLFYRFIFYDGTLHIDPTGKVGFWEKMFASGNSYSGYGSPQVGTIIVEGHLFGNELRPWKNGCPMKLYVMDGGLLELNLLRVGYTEGTPDPPGEFYLSGGLAKLENMVIQAGTDTPSFIDITGGELLILNSNWSVTDVENAIAAGDIFNSNADEGYVLEVTTKDVGGTLYTSVTVVFDPLARAIYLIGEAIAEKDLAKDGLGDAIAMELAAKAFLEEVLMGLDPESQEYEDVEMARSRVHTAIQGEKSCQRKITKTVKKLEQALGLLGAGGGGNPPKPPK